MDQQEQQHCAHHHHHHHSSQPHNTHSPASNSRPSPPLTPSPYKPSTAPLQDQPLTSCHDPLYPIQHTLLAVARLLHTVVAHNDARQMLLRDPITLFHSRAVPPISIAAYLARIHRFIPLTNEVLLNAVIYLARLGAAGSGEAEERAASALAEAAVTAGASSVTTITTTAAIETTTTTTVGAGSQLSESELGQTLNRNMTHHGSALVADWLLSSFAIDGSVAPTTSSSTSTKEEQSESATAKTDSDISSPSHPSPTSPSSSTHFPAHDGPLLVSNICNHHCSSNGSTHELSKGPFVGCCCTTNIKVCTASAPAASASQQVLHSATSALPCTTVACSAASQPTTLTRANKRPRSPMAAPLCDASGTGASVGSHDSSSSSVSMDDEVASKRIKQHQMEQHPLPSISTESSASSLSILTGKEASPRLLWICPASPSQTALAPNGFRLISLNIHRLLITALMVAAKFTSDLYYSNARYAKYGGLRLEELNQLELEFLFAIKFDLNVKVPHIEQVGRLLHAFEQAASPSSSAVVSSSPSPASTPAMMAVDRFSASSSVSPSAEKPTGTASSSAIHPQAPVHAQQHQQYPHSSLPYSASAPTPDASNQPDRGPCQGQGMCQGQSPKSATTHASAVHMQSSSKVVGHLLSPPEEKQHGWDE